MKANKLHPGGGLLTAGTRVLALVMSLVVLIATAYAWVTYRSLSENVGRIDAIGDAEPGVVGTRGAEQNILIIGNDDRTGATPAELEQLSASLDGGASNTDTMMVLHVPAGGTEATVISLPRDSWVPIAGNGEGKLNSAFADGARQGGPADGAKLLIATVQDITGLRIDHYVAVSLLAFYRISEAIGGVPVCLNAAQNRSTDSDGNGAGYSGIDLPAGESVIEGKQALSFVRQRHGLPRGDLDRIVRQQYFLRQAFAKIASAGTLLNPSSLDGLVSAVSSSLQVDQGLDLMQLAGQAQDLSAGNITFVTVPTLGFPDVTYQGTTVSTVQLDYAAIPEFVSEVVGEPTPYVSTAPASPSAVSVSVVHSGTSAEAAQGNADALGALGFTVGETNPVESGALSSQVRYPPGMVAEAKAVVAAVPGAVPVVDRDVAGVTLALTGDGIGVPAPGTTPDGSIPDDPGPEGSGPEGSGTDGSGTDGSGTDGSGTDGAGLGPLDPTPTPAVARPAVADPAVPDAQSDCIN